MLESTLKIFNIQKSIKMEIDALNLVIETCLSQEYKGKWYFIVYYSRKLSSIEQNYDIHELQEFVTFYYNETIKLTTSEIIKTVKIV